MHYDAIVIGLGVMGGATCLELARRGRRVLGLEQYPAVPHAFGSSHGETRVIRRAYFEHPDYVPLLDVAYAGWRRLERESGERLFETCGVLFAGPEQGAVIAGIRRAAAAHDLRVEALAGADVARRFPGLVCPPDDVGLFEPDAGFLHVEAALRAQLALARQLGAELATSVAVEQWDAGAGRIEVVAAGQRHTASALVITAGAWAAALLGTLRLQLVPVRQVMLWLKTVERHHQLEAGAPVFAFDTADGFFYGFPALEPGIMKVARHGRGSPTSPAALERSLLPGDTGPVLDFAARHLPGSEPRVVRHAACLYTMTADGHFVIDRHPAHARVVIGAGFSGHGFKFAPVVAAALADLALEGETGLPVGFLSAARLAGGG